MNSKTAELEKDIQQKILENADLDQLVRVTKGQVESAEKELRETKERVESQEKLLEEMRTQAV